MKEYTINHYNFDTGTFIARPVYFLEDEKDVELFFTLTKSRLKHRKIPLNKLFMYKEIFGEDNYYDEDIYLLENMEKDIIFEINNFSKELAEVRTIIKNNS